MVVEVRNWGEPYCAKEYGIDGVLVGRDGRGFGGVEGVEAGWRVFNLSFGERGATFRADGFGECDEVVVAVGATPGDACGRFAKGA